MKILLVDDHIVVREGVRRLLAGIGGIDVREAASGEEALRMFNEERPDLVLLDLNLVGIGGLELLRRLLALDEKVRVVVFSMHAEPIYAARALRLGARGYVSKSAGAEALVTAAKRISDAVRYVEQDLPLVLALPELPAHAPSHHSTPRHLQLTRLLVARLTSA